MFMILFRYANWKCACFFWLASNIVGSATIYVLMLKGVWWVFTHLVEDNWYLLTSFMHGREWMECVA